MNLKINAPSFEIHNKYEIKLFDKDGNLKQEAVAYNKANSLAQLVERQISYTGISLSYIYLGSRDPKIWGEDGLYFVGSPRILQSYSGWADFESNEKQTKVTVGPYIFPATTSYTGTFTEIGWGQSEKRLLSHAWLVDAEGEPLSITKTEYEEMQITLTIYVYPLLNTDNLFPNFKYYPYWALLAFGNRIIGYRDFFTSSGEGWTMPNCHTTKMVFATEYAPYSTQDYFQEDCIATGDVICSQGWQDFSFSSSGSVIFDSDTGKADYSGAFPYTGEITNKFLTQDSYGNRGFYHSIIFPGLGAIELPCPGLFNGEDSYWVKDITFNNGDGETTNFYTNFNETVINEDGSANIKVYINGSLINQNQYYFVQFDSRKSPLFNKATYVVVNNIQQELGSRNTICERNYVAPVLLTNRTCRANEKSTQYLYPNYDDSSAVIYYDENGITLDHCRIGHIEYSYSKAFACTLSYKDSNEEEWNDIQISMSKEQNSYIFFERTTAKYWRLSSFPYRLFSGLSNTKAGLGPWEQGWDPNTLVFGDSLAHDFTKVGLNFYEPPAEGSVITMDANLNLPYKTSESVMSFSAEVVLDPAAAHTSTEDEEEEDEE